MSVKDSYGEVSLAVDALWGKATQRSLNFFDIGCEKMPQALIESLLIIKRSAARANCKLEVLSKEKSQAIVKACDGLLDNYDQRHYPLSIWQTGSGTQTNMNVNEVIANVTSKEIEIHPNDDVNQSQSSNDVFPAALSMMSLKKGRDLFNQLEFLIKLLEEKSRQYYALPKVGRTHLQDAVLMSVGQEFSGFAGLFKQSLEQLDYAFTSLYRLPLGATAIGTGINAPKNFDISVCEEIADYTGLPFKTSDNKFSDLSGKSALVFFAGVLNTIASNYYKMCNDIRWLSSGPRAGLGEFILPANEAGSSIMPGKVNPTQCESAMMIALHVMTLSGGVTLANSQGNFQLNTMMPLMAYQIDSATTLLCESMEHLMKYALKDLKVNEEVCRDNVAESIMIATRLNPIIGYDQASLLVKEAMVKKCSIESLLREYYDLEESVIQSIFDVESMIFPHR